MTEIQIGDVVKYTPVDPPASSVWRRREGLCFLVLAADLPTGTESVHQLYQATENDWFYAKPKNLTLVSAANHSPTVLALIAPKDDE